jgi:hypothetical protein
VNKKEIENKDTRQFASNSVSVDRYQQLKDKLDRIKDVIQDTEIDQNGECEIDSEVAIDLIKEILND